MRRIIGTKFKSEIKLTFAAFLGEIMFKVTNGRLYNKAYARYRRDTRNEWDDHCYALQAELDAQYKRGFGFRFIDGCRTDRKY